jgi:hypothetical protein
MIMLVVNSIKNYRYSEWMFLKSIERPPEVRNATILVIFGGVLHILFGYQFYLLSMAPPNSLLVVVSVVMIGLGISSVGISTGLWQRRSWATKTTTGVGLAICSTHILFGYYQMAALAAIIYWVAINQLKNSHVKEPSD